MNHDFSREMATSDADNAFPVPKLLADRRECSQATGTNTFVSNSENVSEFPDPKCHFNEKATDVKFNSPKPVDRSESRNENNTVSRKQTVNAGTVQTSNCEENINNASYNKEDSKQSSGNASRFSLWRDISSRIENLPNLEKNSPFITYAKCMPTFDVNLAHSISYQTASTTEMFQNIQFAEIQEVPLRNDTSSNELKVALGLHGQNENLIKDSTSGFETDGKIFVSNELENIIQISKQLLDIDNKNRLREESSYSKCNPLPDDFYNKYIGLYHERQPRNYNYSMNVMAFIELLEDISWTETTSHLSDNVKKYVYIYWNRRRPNQLDSQMIDINIFQKTIIELLYTGKVDSFVDFFHRSIFVCGIGVMVRKYEIKAALLVIAILQKRVEEIEKIFKFEEFIEHHTKDFVKQLEQLMF